MKLPDRNDDIYKEIEKFEDYEYTNCIAYEMFIRNSNIEKIIENIKLDNFDDSKIIEFEEKYLIDYDEFIVYLFSVYRDDERLKLLITDLLEQKGIRIDIDSLLKKVNEEDFQFFENNRLHRVVFKSKEHLVYDFLEKTSLAPNISSRPTLICKSIHNIKSDELNFNLPKEELLAYISKIKDDYDKANSIIKSPLVLFTEELDKAESFSMTSKKTDKINKEHIADMFFIYDAFKNGIKKNRTQRSIVEYYTEKYPDKFIPNMDYKTINKYLNIAVEYIDNLKYKELITGVKN